MNGIERLLAGSRYLTVITILLSMLAAVSLYIAAILSFIGVILQALGAGPWVPKVSKEAAIGILNIIDLLDLMSTTGYVTTIERGPGRHGISNAFFLYIRDRDGHRTEI